jgi:hypothetical protein
MLLAEKFPLNTSPLIIFPIHQSRICYSIYSALSMYTYKPQSSLSCSILFSLLSQDMFRYSLCLFHARCFFVWYFPTEHYYAVILFLRIAMWLICIIFLDPLIIMFFHFLECNLFLGRTLHTSWWSTSCCSLCPSLQLCSLTTKIIDTVPSA